ncbi:MAG TPA: hypothetical protein VG942_14765, partial [Hyphomonadaceae bacterium]|nr:hypothetical protein [Hyphomonadaceae bacterium]
MTAIRLNPDLDRAALRAAFDRDHRLHVPDVLASESARLLHDTLHGSPDWVMVFNRGNKHFEVSPESA